MHRRLLWTLGLIALSAGPTRAAVDWQVTESSRDVLRLRIRVEGARLETLPQGGADSRIYARVRIPGLSDGGEPGLPLLPSAGRWLVVPPRGEVKLDVRVQSTRELGIGRLMPHPSPAVNERAGLDEPPLDERVIEGPGYGSFRHGPDLAVRLEEPVYMRHQRMAALRVEPVFYDAATGRVQVATEIEVEIRFAGGPAGGIDGGQPDPSVTGSVLNPQQAASWRCLSPEQEQHKEIWATGPSSSLRRAKGSARVGVELFDPSLLLSDEYRVRVDLTGLRRVSLSDLIDDHGLPTSVLRRNLRLYQKRVSDPASPDYPLQTLADVPLHFVGNPDENQPISRSDQIVFYAFSAEDDWVDRDIDGQTFPRAMPDRPDSYNSFNVYWLAAMDDQGAGWARMTPLVLGASQGSPQPSYRLQESFTGDAGYQDNPISPDVERYHWNQWRDDDVTKAIPIHNPVAGAQLDLTWSAVSYFTFGEPKIIHFFLEKDGQTWELRQQNMATSTYRVLQDFNAQLDLDPIGGGFLSFKMQRPDPNAGGALRSLGAFLGRIDVAYEALYAADFDQSVFTTNLTGTDVDLEVTGFTTANLLVYDLTDPRQPAVVTLQSPNVVASGSDFTLSLHVPQAPGELRRFSAQPVNRITKVRSDLLERDPVADLFENLSNVQVLAIGPEELRAGMQPWLQWRRSTDIGFNWNYEYVDVQQIYDHFSGGLQSPWAIKALAEYAYTEWDARALLIVGDGNEDTRGIGEFAGPNLVPPSLHLQSFSSNRELLASDKWYGLFGVGSTYPSGLVKGPDMMVGRLPVNGPGMLQTVLDKILAYEKPKADDDWRRRTLWMADDAYSTDYLGGIQDPCYNFRLAEMEFLNSQQRAADMVSTALDGAMQGQIWSLDDFTSVCRQGVPCENLTEVRGCTLLSAPRELENRLSEGWLMVSYQGHANFNILSHESLLSRNAISTVRNAGRPFLFFGMGCHVTDFLQAEEGRLQSPIGEYFLTVGSGGAVATYGSSGFEFLTPNATYMELITSNFFVRGRVNGPVLGQEALRSQWILGEELAQSELDILATNAFKKDEMMAQYNLLGDPLLRMDAAPPRLAARLGQTPLAAGTRLLPPSGSRTAGLSFDLTDETGISRLSITDSKGRDLSSLVQLGADVDPRQRTATVDLPIHAQGYTIDFALYDAAYPEARPTTLQVEVPFDLTVRVNGKPVEEGQGSFAVGSTASLDVEFTSPIALADNELNANMEGAQIFGLSKSQLDGEGRQWRMSFNAEAVQSAEPQTIVLSLAGDETRFALTAQAETEFRIAEHYPFPNPADPSRQPVRFVARASRAVDWARLTVYDLNGRVIFDGREPASGSELVYVWDGRDLHGDELANGVYFYRLEAGDGAQTARSDMGRVVMMR